MLVIVSTIIGFTVVDVVALIGKVISSVPLVVLLASTGFPEKLTTREAAVDVSEMFLTLVTLLVLLVSILATPVSLESV